MWIFLVVGPVLFLSLMLLNLCIPVHRDWSSIPPTIVGIRMIRKQSPTVGLSSEHKYGSWWLPSPACRSILHLSFMSRCDVQLVRCITCFFDLWYFQFTRGLSVCNLIVSWGRPDFSNMTEPFVLMFLISYVATHLLYLLSLCHLSFHESRLSFGNLMKAIRVNVLDGNEM